MRAPRAPLEPDCGASFTTVRLVGEGHVWTYRPTSMGRVFPGVFTFLGYAAMAGAIPGLLHEPLAGVAFLGFGALFVWVGRRLREHVEATACFDTLGRRIDIPGRRPFWPPHAAAAGRQLVRFDEVAELEIIEKTIASTDGGDYTNHECNLVLKDGRRFNLVSHPGIELIASEAARLSKLLGVPVVDSRTSGSSLAEE